MLPVPSARKTEGLTVGKRPSSQMNATTIRSPLGDQSSAVWSEVPRQRPAPATADADRIDLRVVHVPAAVRHEDDSPRHPRLGRIAYGGGQRRETEEQGDGDPHRG